MDNPNKFFINNELLIEEIQQRPCLYDTKCHKYKNIYEKKRSWENICRVIFSSWDQFSLEDQKQASKLNYVFNFLHNI